MGSHEGFLERIFTNTGSTADEPISTYPIPQNFFDRTLERVASAYNRYLGWQEQVDASITGAVCKMPNIINRGLEVMARDEVQVQRDFLDRQPTYNHGISRALGYCVDTALLFTLIFTKEDNDDWHEIEQPEPTITKPNLMGISGTHGIEKGPYLGGK
jgi:hypothetical protein